VANRSAHASRAKGVALAVQFVAAKAIRAEIIADAACFGFEGRAGIGFDHLDHLRISLRANPAVDVLCASNTDVASA
jgi:hypothetical protein